MRNPSTPTEQHPKIWKCIDILKYTRYACRDPRTDSMRVSTKLILLVQKLVCMRPFSENKTKTALMLEDRKEKSMAGRKAQTLCNE